MNDERHTWEVYSASGRLMHRGNDEEIARYGLATWPRAKTLLCDGKLADENDVPKPTAGMDKPK